MEADIVITELFEVSETISTDDNIISKARLRMELGRPPGKKGSLGDALCWELLLDIVPSGEDIYFVSDDSDYESPLERTQIHPYLEQEWSTSKESKIVFYKRLSSFFRENFPHIRLASELEKEVLIRDLGESRNFRTTHITVSRLARYPDFADSQVNEIVHCVVSNRQVYWIANDPDVRSFLDNLLKDREHVIEPTVLNSLRFVQGGLEPYQEMPTGPF